MTDEQWADVKHFQKSEFTSPDTGEEFMDIRLLQLLDNLREYIDNPIIITSGYRTPKHNIAVGGSPTSRHLMGLACDIACPNAGYMGKVIDFAIRWDSVCKVYGIGVGKGFIHLDIDKGRENLKVWGY